MVWNYINMLYICLIFWKSIKFMIMQVKFKHYLISGLFLLSTLSQADANIITNRKSNICGVLTDTLTKESIMHDHVILKWTNTQIPNNIEILDSNGTILKNYIPTQIDLSNSSATIVGLAAETPYILKIYQDTLILGAVYFTTTSANEVIVSGNSDLAAIVAAAPDGAVLRLKNDVIYKPLSNINIKQKNLTIESFQEEKSIVVPYNGNNPFQLDRDSMNNFCIKSMNITGFGPSLPFINIIALSYIKSIIIDDCIINSYKSLITGPTTLISMHIGLFVVNNCIISNMQGSSSLIDFRNGVLPKVYITNSTIYNFNRGLIRGSSSLASTNIMSNQYIEISNNTIYNCIEATTSHMLFTGTTSSPNTGTYIIKNNIFANSTLTSGGFQFAGNTSLINNNFYKFKVESTPVDYTKPLDKWGGVRAWTVSTGNYGDDTGIDGINPNFAFVPSTATSSDGNFTLPDTSSLKGIGDPRWYCNVKENTLVITQNKESSLKIDIYPNPTKNGFYVKGLKSASKIFLFNSVGTLVEACNLTNEGYVSVENFPQGIYLIKVKDEDNNVIVQKLIKE